MQLISKGVGSPESCTRLQLQSSFADPCKALPAKSLAEGDTSVVPPITMSCHLHMVCSNTELDSRGMQDRTAAKQADVCLVACSSSVATPSRSKQASTPNAPIASHVALLRVWVLLRERIGRHCFADSHVQQLACNIGK